MEEVGTNRTYVVQLRPGLCFHVVCSELHSESVSKLFNPMAFNCCSFATSVSIKIAA